MNKIYLTFLSLGFLLLTIPAQAGMTIAGMGQATPNPDAQPGSQAFGMHLDEWIGTHLRWLEAGQDPETRVKNAAFLPIIGESPFSVEVEPGTALVLPIALWLGVEGEPELAPSDFVGAVTVDGQPVAEPNIDFYVDPTPIDPPLFGELVYFQGLGVVIKPLTPGAHTIVLFSSVNTPDGPAEFNNTWNITVARPK